jgi:hypothetical protein
MTSNDGRKGSSFRGHGADQRPARAGAPRRGLSSRARATARVISVGHPTGAPRARARRHRGGEDGRTDAAVQNRPEVLRPRGAPSLLAPSPRTRSRSASPGRRATPATEAGGKADLKISSHSGLPDVAAAVGSALRNAGIEVVLTGGGCATIYSGGAYQSRDLDFILGDAVSQKRLDEVMASAGFRRNRDHYVHPRTDYFVEFPRGPLSIGRDFAVRAVKLRIGRTWVSALSATDSCRDRLAAYYFWDDLSSLKAAIEIARRQAVNLRAIRKWSAIEGHLPKFESFRKALSEAIAKDGE